MLKPKIVVEDFVDKIAIYYAFGKTVYLRYCDIEGVGSNNCRFGRGSIIYSFGTLIIETKDKVYKIGIVKDVEQARKHIWKKIAYKYAY